MNNLGRLNLPQKNKSFEFECASYLPSQINPMNYLIQDKKPFFFFSFGGNKLSFPAEINVVTRCVASFTVSRTFLRHELSFKCGFSASNPPG
jgi:hypothetical protein